MPPTLRPYQIEFKRDIFAAWECHKNVLAVLPTGGGKTSTFADILHNYDAPSCLIVHRQELVLQASLALGRLGVQHAIIAPDKLIRLAVSRHVEELGINFIRSNARCVVAGVDTLIRRRDLETWGHGVKLWVLDEAHHALTHNKWGRAIAMFPNAAGLGVTATPMRADGYGLGRDASGVFDALVVGASMLRLQNEGYLTPYRIFAPPLQNLDMSGVSIAADGEYNHEGVKQAIRKTRIVGDVVEHYQRLASGKLGVTFASDTETGGELAAQYNKMGIKSALITAKTPDKERAELIAAFRARVIKNLVNVDIFGEGFDLPAIEVVSMARPTQSFGLFCQQFGRALRPVEGKTHAIIIDHVGNVQRLALKYGLPDTPRVWTLHGRKKQDIDDLGLQVRVCLGCSAVFERTLLVCPYCGKCVVSAPRNDNGRKVAAEEGDLAEMSPDMLISLRHKINKLAMSEDTLRQKLTVAGESQHVINYACASHRKRREAQAGIRDAIALWAGRYKQIGFSDNVIHTEFLNIFGRNILSAQTLSTKDAILLTEQIRKEIAQWQTEKVQPMLYTSSSQAA